MEEKKNRRADDRRHPGELDWDGAPTAADAERDRLAAALARDGAAYLDLVGTAGVLIPISGEILARYVVVGSLPAIASVLPIPGTATLLAAPSSDDVRNAARYRWLRDPDTDVSLVLDKRTGFVPPVEGMPGVGGYHTYEYRAGDELDAAIDAAMEVAEIALARAGQQAGDAAGVKTWQERMPEHVRFLGTASSEAAYKDAEIADLRRLATDLRTQLASAQKDAERVRVEAYAAGRRDANDDAARTQHTNTTATGE